MEEGDTLWGLAETYYLVPFYWPHIWTYNDNLADPNRILVNDSLWLPTLEGAPGSLTAADRRSIAEGYLRLYYHMRAEGAPNAADALVGVRYYDASVLPPELRDPEEGTPAEDVAEAGETQPRAASDAEEPVTQPAPSTEAAVTSSGAYVGLHAGMAMLGTDLEGPRGHSNQQSGTLDAEFGNRGGIAGGFVGYSWSVDRWLMALELEADTGKVSWDHGRAPAGKDYSLEREESYALSGRLGYWLSSAALIYGRAGLARTTFHAEYDDGTDTADVTERSRGIRFGTGVEVALSDRLFGRLDWRYTDHDPIDVDYGSGEDEYTPSESVASLGLGYRFFEGSSRQAPSRDASQLGGAYLGLALGWNTLHTENTGDQRGGSGGNVLTVDRAGAGALAGAFGGYGIELGPAYLGVELEAEASRASWDTARRPDKRIYGVERGTAYGVGLRVGYVIDGAALVYVRGARMRTEFETDYEFASEGVSIDDTRTLDGNRAGLGIELPVSEHLFVRADYSYTDYEEYDITYGSSNGTGTESFDNDEDQFRLGLGYWF
ncbi:outer membrane beta-barrel protein [Ectothiorhodospiraceae bacterium WFHF3C12]|nr:outer membrane beta-barrel protein [Ectothiorhodospiraceae bacterium WFHF3C12]